MPSYAAQMHKNILELLLLLYNLRIFASDQIKEESNKKCFWFFEQLSLQKATFAFFLTTF